MTVTSLFGAAEEAAGAAASCAGAVAQKHAKLTPTASHRTIRKGVEVFMRNSFEGMLAGPSAAPDTTLL
jgi:hypothetical protein